MGIIILFLGRENIQSFTITSDVSHRFFVNAFNGLRKFILFLADLVFLLVMDDEFCQMLFFFSFFFFIYFY